MKKSWFVSALILTALFTVATSSLADVPKKINYQGYLTNSAGAPLTGTYPMVFSLCGAPSGGNCPWSESQSIAVDKGIFNVALGAVTPITLTFDVPYFLDIQVNGEQMSARQPLTSVGYAFRSETASSVSGNAFTGLDAIPAGAGVIPAANIPAIPVGDGVITDANMSATAAITDTKLATISSAGKVANSATSATSANTANAIALRDASGNFSAGTITANLSGNATTATTAGNITGTVGVANGGTGTSNGSITGTGELTFAAGGMDTGIKLVPNGSGTVDVASKRITGVATPAGGSDAANKAYVDASALPPQSGNSGKYLTTNGTTASWGSIPGGGSSFVQTYTVTSTNTTGNGTYYLLGTGQNASEIDAHRIVPIACSSGTLWAALTATPANTATSYTLTVRKGQSPNYVTNAADTALSCTVGYSQTTCSSTASISLAAGNSISIKNAGNTVFSGNNAGLMVTFMCN
jgi:hypothetical protein